MFEKFLVFILARDVSKWYTFSIVDLMLLAWTGVKHFTSDGEYSCIGLWLFVIAFNVVSSYFYNRRNK